MIMWTVTTSEHVKVELEGRVEDHKHEGEHSGYLDDYDSLPKAMRAAREWLEANPMEVTDCGSIVYYVASVWPYDENDDNDDCELIEPAANTIKLSNESGPAHLVW